MQAFQDIRIEMRESCISLTGPSAPKRDPARIARGNREQSDPANDLIEPWMEAAFYGLTHASETDEPFALIPCSMNGEPAVELIEGVAETLAPQAAKSAGTAAKTAAKSAKGRK